MLPAGAVPGTGGSLGETRNEGPRSYRWGAGSLRPPRCQLGQQPPAEGYLVLEFFPKSAPAPPCRRPIVILPNIRIRACRCSRHHPGADQERRRKYAFSVQRRAMDHPRTPATPSALRKARDTTSWTTTTAPAFAVTSLSMTLSASPASRAGRSRAAAVARAVTRASSVRRTCLRVVPVNCVWGTAGEPVKLGASGRTPWGLS